MNFYYRLTFLLKFKNCCKYICEILYAHFFFFLSLDFCVFLLPSCYSLIVYQIDLSVLFLAVLVFCFTVSQYHGRHIIINVSRSKCEYFVFSVFVMEACTFRQCILLILRADEWRLVCTVLCETRSASSSREYLLFVPFEQLVQGIF